KRQTFCCKDCAGPSWVCENCMGAELMKTGNRQDEGSVLTVILVVIVLIGITLGSYLGLVANQDLCVQRSLAWNSGIAVAEAGIEEALAHLNRNGTNRVGDGWALAADGTNVWRK